MRSDHFVFWLNGYVELTNGQHPDALQWQIIKDHLKEVFDKVTPDRYPLSYPTPANLGISGCGVAPVLGSGDMTKITVQGPPITC